MGWSSLLAKSRHTQENRLFTLHAPVPDAGLLLDQIEGTESLCAPFSFTLDLLSERADLVLKDFLGKPMGVALRTAGGADRWFHGHVTRFSHTSSDGGFAHYRATLEPWTGFLTHRTNCKLFQQKNVIAIIQEVFKDYGHLARAEFRLKDADYPEITLCVQYQESDFSFVSRLLEAHGIYYFFRFEKDGHILVLADDSRVAPSVPEGTQLSYNTLPGAARTDTIDAWSLGEAIQPTDFSTTSFDFKNPLDHTENRWHTTHPAAVPTMEHYEPAGAYGFKDHKAGERRAQLRMEQLERGFETYDGAGNVRTLTCGHSFELRDHYRKTTSIHDRLFLVTKVEHKGNNNYRESGGRAHYRNTFSCAPRAVQYRPAIVTPRPVIHGPQTATVVGAPGTEIFTDQYGRVKLQFHWDRLGKFNDASSAWVRVSSPMAGRRFGFIAIPRVNEEVVVEFLDGNPDRPLITGAVYNELKRPPWELPENRTQSGILTRSSKGGDERHANALRFEDKKGEEEVWLHAEKDQRIEVEHDESHTVDHDRRKTVGNDETTEVGHDRTEHVGNDEAVTIDGSQTTRVEKSQHVRVALTKNENVGLTSTEQVGAAKTVSVGAAYAVTVAGGKNEAVGLGSFEQVGKDKRTIVGSTFSIQVKEQFEITVGKAKFVMNQDGTVTVNGKQINILAEGPLKLAGKDIEAN
jgi:type VI secretion system secreted protein VgrG